MCLLLSCSGKALPPGLSRARDAAHEADSKPGNNRAFADPPVGFMPKVKNLSLDKDAVMK
jgi:hypothetical protein